ncbi:AMP-binding protein [Chondromyces apiculatus]|uniref:Long-chain-fatty-acid--CoA ligase n=1 Tax=Chondromyces apiculatus DSM 436 TaxID=1192034 RepID=A0A017TCD2_9BACT|nr:AMP-binding protein [Chondromyces apiculatus]EYF06286.1 Long-chain-fatty-acid--CoA ligase [Chondromyces apiculatus DSM 436]
MMTDRLNTSSTGAHENGQGNHAALTLGAPAAQATQAAQNAQAGQDAPPLVPSQVLAGKRLVVVGGTGFLGKVWLSMLLTRFPEVEHLYLLVRPKADQSPEERFWSQIITSPVFDPVREQHPGAAFEDFIRKKITPVAGDVVEPLLGLAPLVPELTGKTAAVVNVAGVVDFNPPLDEALDVNAFGVNNLAELARALGAPVMHTSTCYVAGYRSGLIEEVNPAEVPFPRAKGTTWYGASCPKRPLDRSHWDPQREIDECLDLIKQARQRCDDAFRQSAFLDQAKHNLEKRGEPCRGSALDNELAKVKRKFIKDHLTEAGQERALFWGWTNIYTYTKSIGEQVLAASGVPFTIVRPAVIESSSEFPCPGWNEGINTSAPLLYLMSKGQVQILGDHDVRLDLIPVDMVCSGMIASLCELIEGRAPAVYQYGSTDGNGCRITRYLELMGLYKRHQVQIGKRTTVFDMISQYFEPRGITLKEYETHGSRRIANTLKGLGGLLHKAGVGPAAALFKPAAKALEAAARAEEQTAMINEVFKPFTAEGDWVFSCANTRAAFDRMPPEERAAFVWYPEKIDWRHWMFEVHLPGLERWVFPEIDARFKRELKALRPYDNLIDMLDELAERHDHALALQQLTGVGLTRTSYREMREAALATASRLRALGLAPGDRVILTGQNQPAWPIAYFGILCAGGVVVPVDPGLEALQLANIARSSTATIALWDESVEEKIGGAARDAIPALRIFDLAAFTEPLAPEEGLALPAHRPHSEDLASVIYTSGTTGEPKGVMLTHSNFTALIASLIPVFPLGERDRVLSVLPLHHTFEFTCGLLLPLSQGARIIYLDELHADRLSEGLKQGRVTAMVGVPALWQMLERRIMSRVKEQGKATETAVGWAMELNRLLGKRLGVNAGRLFFGSVHAGLGGSVRYLISGGAALPKDTAEVFSGLGLHLSEGYGLTEAAPVLTVAKASPRARAGHVGKPIPGVTIKIQSPDAGGVGEVLARGPNVMKGYFGNTEATSQALDDEGWLHTGDLGKLDKRGQLVIVGRAKEVIVAASGENVYPDDVENLLGKIDHVKELSIVGIDDGRGGERVACLAVPEVPAGIPGLPGSLPGSPEQGEALSSRAERREKALTALRDAIQKLPRVAQPAVVHLYDADLPRTVTRKIKRTEVKAILSRLSSAVVPLSAEGGSASATRHALAAIASRKPTEISAAMSLKGDLGFDSLMAMELSVALEAQLSRPLDVNRLARCETVGDVETLMAESGAAAVDTRIIEEAAPEEEPIRVPPVIADAAKKVLTAGQMGFYGKVMRPTVYGRAYIPHNRSTIVASNHASHLDMGLVKYALGSYGEELVSLAAQDYFFEDRWRRAYFENLTNLAPFDRKGGLRQALRQAGDLLERGRTVLIFPEGTRSPDGAVHEFKSVIGHLALSHDVDILPVYLGGTFEALPKGRSLPTRRDVVARIGPPLNVTDLRRLTAGMKPAAAYRKVAELTQRAVTALRDGGVLDLSRIEHLDDAASKKEHPLVALFREVTARYVPGRVEQSVTYYITLGPEADDKWTLRVDPDGCGAHLGKPPSGQADCVLKTSPEIFTKMIREGYVPGPVEIMSGQVKSNDASLLLLFPRVFDLGGGVRHTDGVGEASPTSDAATGSAVGVQG